MSAQPAPEGAAATDADRFAWHPTYRGRTLDEVRAGIEQELGRDQRAYTLALEGAERQENAALASVIELERKWGTYDLDWAETEPGALAERVAAFEQVREQRRELIPYAAYRAELAPAPTATAGRTASGRTAPPLGGRPPLPWLAVALAVILLLVLFLAL